MVLNQACPLHPTPGNVAKNVKMEIFLIGTTKGRRCCYLMGRDLGDANIWYTETIQPQRIILSKKINRAKTEEL
jgi:hypothetical protein